MKPSNEMTNWHRLLRERFTQTGEPEAMRLVEERYSLGASWVDGYSVLGGIRREAGDWAGAKELMSRDFDCNRMSAHWKLRFAEVLAEVGEEEAGSAVVLQVYQQEPEAMDGYARLGWVKARRRDWEAAAELMGRDWQARKMSPEWQVHYAPVLARTREPRQKPAPVRVRARSGSGSVE